MSPAPGLPTVLDGGETYMADGKHGNGKPADSKDSKDGGKHEKK